MKIFRVSIKYRDAASQLENGNTEILCEFHKIV